MGRNLQVSNPRARLPFSRVERKEVRKVLRAAPPSVVGFDAGVIRLLGGGAPTGASHCISNRLALPLRKISVRYREPRLRRLRLVTSRHDLALRMLAANAWPPTFSGRSSQLRALYQRLGVMCCAYSTSTSTPATQFHSQRNTMLINQHNQPFLTYWYSLFDIKDNEASFQEWMMTNSDCAKQ